MRGRSGKRPLGQYRLPTGSSIARAMACAGSVVFPHVRHAPGPAARRGTVIHKFIEEARAIGRVKALDNIKDDGIRNLCNAIDLNLFPPYLESEATYELDVNLQTARAIHIDKPRDYPYNAHCFYGTADLVGFSEDGGTVIVIDIKTGRRLADHARDNWQLRFLAVAAAAAHGAKDAKVALAYVNEAGDVEFEWAEFTSLDLADYMEELSWLDSTLLKVSEAVASGYAIDLAIGSHCDWCPALLNCPAHMDTMKSMDADLAATRGELDQLSPESLGKLYDRLSAYETILKEVRSSFRTMANSGPIEIGDSKQLRFVSNNHTIINSKKQDEFVQWLVANGPHSCLRVTLDPMATETLDKARELGFVVDAKLPTLRKVNKKC